MAWLALAACGPVNPEGAAGTLVPDCRAVADGVLQSAELPVQAGLRGTWVRNTPGTTVAPPEVGEDGFLDLRDGPDEVGATYTLGDPAEQPEVAALFPDAGWTAPLTLESPDLLAAWRLGEEGLQLLGLSAPGAAAAAAVEVVYDEPVLALALPLEPGRSWGQTATFSDALLVGLPQAGVEHWSLVAEAGPPVRLPGGVEVDESFVVHSTVTARYALEGPTLQAVLGTSWYAPCFGEVAAVVRVGADDGPVREFRRLLP